jgi:hypothetical protein
MNIFLFAPGLLLLMLKALGPWYTAARLIGVCALLQVCLGMPFMLVNFWGYLGKAFEFDRVFFYKWTVNWKFLDEEVFLSKRVALILLACHFGGLILFATFKWTRGEQGLWNASRLAERFTSKKKDLENRRSDSLTPKHVTLVLFTCNFLGIAFCRTLHYQFYCWYYHTLPMLLWSCPLLPTPVRLALMAGIEVAFNVFPATPWSSAILQGCHWVLVLALWLRPQEPASAVTMLAPRAQAIIKHMNKDHSNNIAQYAQFYGKLSAEQAKGATIDSIDVGGMLLSLFYDGKRQECYIPYPRSMAEDGILMDVGSIRKVYVDMAKEAASALGEELHGNGHGHQQGHGHETKEPEKEKQAASVAPRRSTRLRAKKKNE